MKIDNNNWTEDIARRLKEGKSQPSAELWDRIESTRTKPKERGALISLRRTIAIAASIVVLIACGLYLTQRESSIVEPASLLGEVQSTNDPEPTIDQTEPSTQSEEPSKAVIRQNRSPKSERLLAEHVEPVTEQSTPTNDSAPQQDNEKIESIEPQKTRETGTKTTESPSRNNYSQPYYQHHNKKRSNTLQLGLSSSLIAQNNTPIQDSFSKTTSSLSDFKQSYTAGAMVYQSPQQSSYVYKHSQPITAKLSITKDIGSGFRVGTGATYTLLNSEATNFRETLDQQLHYVGIPLSVDYTLLNIGDLSLYASAEGSLEIPVYAKRGDEKIKDQPLDYSASLGVGVQYALSRRAMLFAEPKASKFFNSGEIESFRTENDVVFNLAVGLRISY